jgi:pyridinium-3,5-bisthiocarboxylic acid mononucleotide nickel chelatase
MSKLLYFDCFSGASGDMVLGALLDAGLPIEALRDALGSLAMEECEVAAARVLRAGVSATKFTVREHVGESGGHLADSHEHPAESPRHPAASQQHHHHPHRTLKEIGALIDQSALSPTGRERAKALFERLARAEAEVHQMALERIHLHEVGALDSIVDVVGAVYGLEWFGADRILASPLNIGGGTVQTSHGLFPVPAPATIKLLEGVPIYSGAIRKELVTPTGALIVSSYAEGFGGVPAMTVERTGYGAGDHDFPDNPNVLRVLVGRSAESSRAGRVLVVECEIDDMNPQIFGVVMDRLYAAGALDVFYTAVQMKKNRPGTLLTIVAPPDRRGPLADIIFRETTTIGVRYSEVDRECLTREAVPVETRVGTVRMKVARRDGRIVNAAPEFEDCARLAAEHGLPVKEVQALAVQAYGAANGGSTA